MQTLELYQGTYNDLEKKRQENLEDGIVKDINELLAELQEKLLILDEILGN